MWRHLVADLSPWPVETRSQTGLMLWIAGGFLVLALVLAIVWFRRQKM